MEHRHVRRGRTYLDNAVRIGEGTRVGDLATLGVTETEVTSGQDKVKRARCSDLGLVIVGKDEAVRTNGGGAVGRADGLACIRADVPHAALTQRRLEELHGRVGAHLLSVDDGLGDRVDRGTVVVQEDAEGGLELGRLGRDLVDRNAVEVERIRVRDGLDLGDARRDGTGGFGVEDGDVVGVGSARHVELVDGRCPSHASFDVGAREIEQAGRTMQPHVLACFELGDLGAGSMGGVVERSTKSEDVVGLAAGPREELVRQRGEGDGNAQVGDQARHRDLLLEWMEAEQKQYGGAVQRMDGCEDGAKSKSTQASVYFAAALRAGGELQSAKEASSSSKRVGCTDQAARARSYM